PPSLPPRAGAPGLLAELRAAGRSVPDIVLRDRGANDPGPSAEPASGRVPRYRLLREVARGGMGVVLRGVDLGLNRELAFKVLHEDCGSDPAAVRRFLEEAQVAGQLQHPNIVPVHELGRLEDGRLYLAMKLVKGNTLRELLARRPEPTRDLPRFVGIFQQVC